jgi:hypothetical protein
LPIEARQTPERRAHSPENSSSVIQNSFATLSARNGQSRQIASPSCQI